MGVDSRNPLFDLHVADWEQMRDSYRGERIVKQAGRKYLPATSGMIADGIENANQKGSMAYDAYRVRSRFPDLVREAVEALLGVMWHKPAAIELPKAMEFLRDNATVRNESLQMLLRRVNEEQLVLGRVGMLADVADSGERKDEPYISTYMGERIINWDEGRSDGIEVQNLNFVSINETEDERIADFEWEEQRKYRVLLLTRDESDEAAAEVASATNVHGTGSDGNEPVVNLPEGEGIYRMGIFRESSSVFVPISMITPSIRGRKLNEIPFVFVNTKDVTPEPDDPPLLGLSNLNMAIYRGEADYRQSLFMQGQDTLVVIGAVDDDAHRTGAGAAINIANVGGDAKYIGVSSTGLPEQRLSLENDYTRAGARGGQLLDTVGGDQQSGEALRIRVAAKTATLNQIALAGAFALERILKIIARWLGVDEDQVVVLPNFDFADDRMSGKQVTELMAGKTLGAPLSLESVHAQMQEGGLTDKSFEEEVAQIEKERSLDMSSGGSTDEDGPEDDEDAIDSDDAELAKEDEEEEEDDDDA